MYNIMTCSGFGTEILGSCSIAWFAIGVLVFFNMIIRRQLENAGMGYNLWGGFVGGLFPFIIIISIWGTVKWSLAAGLVGCVILGLLVGMVLGEE